MIITESDRDSESKSGTPDSTSIAQTSQRSANPPPPAYNSDPGSSTSTASERSLMRPLAAPKGREPAGQRFCTAFCFAALVYILLAGLGKGIVHLSGKLIQNQPDGPYDTDGRVVRCIKTRLHPELEEQQQFSASLPPNPPYTARVSYSVPSSSSLIFLLSRGSYDYSSSVTLEMSDKSGDDVEIEVAMNYFNNAALDRAQVCLLERDEGGRGVGIFTPRTYYPRPRDPDRIKFAITLRFPKPSSSENPLVINALDTRMGIWSHQIQALQHLVVFKSLSIHGSNAPIRVQSVSADAAIFKTSNSPISGFFNVFSSLVLATSNSPITTNIEMENHDLHNPTWLSMKTSNGFIKTTISLVSAQRDVSSQAAFSVDVKTSNSPLVVGFIDAPVSPFSLLDLTAKTSNSPATVTLHATYEGSILLKTSNPFTAGLTQTPGTQDPSGQGRHRTIDVRRVVKSVFEAGVWWGDDPNEDEGKGTVVVTTSNSKNMVVLG